MESKKHCVFFEIEWSKILISDKYKLPWIYE